jgi:hypothetical protein
MVNELLARRLLVVAATVAANFGIASAQEPATSREVAIDYADAGSITDWHAENDRQLYIRDRTGRWHLATLGVSFPQLASSRTIGFEPGLGGRFERFSTVAGPVLRCRVESLVRASRPEAKGGREDKR